MNPNHDTIPVAHPDSSREPVPIDAMIAPLIEAMWARGIRTNSSCQQPDPRQNRASIDLELDDANDLAMILEECGDDELVWGEGIEWHGWIDGGLRIDLRIAHDLLAQLVAALKDEPHVPTPFIPKPARDVAQERAAKIRQLRRQADALERVPAVDE